MEFFLNDPNIERHPPAETRLLDLRAEPDSDRKRLRVALDLTPFQQRPTIELSLTDSDGTEAASASIVEPIGWKLELILHIRKPALQPVQATKPRGTIEESDTIGGKYTLTASLSYPELGEIDRRKITVEMPSPYKQK